MTKKCWYKVGLLSLSNCGNTAVATCELCNRPVCAEHHQTVQSKSVCLECFMKEEIKRQGSASKSGQTIREKVDQDDPTAKERARRGLNDDYDYYPYYYRSYYYSDYDETGRNDASMTPGDFTDS